MAEANLPRILIVDDEDSSQHTIGLAERAASRARHPNDVVADDLEWADLVLMDFLIKNWAERDMLEQASLSPPNGLALASVLREHADSRSNDKHNYTAFALHTGHVGEVSRRLQTTNSAAHVVARLNNLEWVFEKDDQSRFARSTELATAVRVISGAWSEVERQGLEIALVRLMGLTAERPWYSRALDEVVLCQVPLSQFSAGTNGLLFLRWLLHSVLPYPTFLWGEQWVAARLRITPKALRLVLKGNSVLARDLRACRYDGILSSFLGERWWRAGLEQYAWEIRAAGATEPKAFHKELEARADTKLDHVDLASPVVCIDRYLLPADDLCSLEDVVRMVPDLWPAYAGTAYASIASVRADPDFAAVVHPLDRDRIVSDSSEDDDSEE